MIQSKHNPLWAATSASPECILPIVATMTTFGEHEGKVCLRLLIWAGSQANWETTRQQGACEADIWDVSEAEKGAGRKMG